MVVPTIISIIAASSDVVSVVGDRIFPVAIPQKETRPSVCIAIDGNDPQDTNKLGRSPVDVMNIALYLEAKTYEQMDVMSQKIRDLFNAYRGDLVDTIRFNTMNDLDYNNDTHTYARMVYYTVRVNNTD